MWKEWAEVELHIIRVWDVVGMGGKCKTSMGCGRHGRGV